MPTLQLRLNEYKKTLESAAPKDEAPHEVIETMRGDTAELNDSGLVLPIPVFRKNKSNATLVLPPTVKKDVFLSALLEMHTIKQPRRSPLEWAGATAVHLLILAALIIVPLYSTGTIKLPEYNAVPLIAPPPPPPPAPAAAVAPRVVHTQTAQLTYKLHRLSAPTAIPKKVSLGDASAPPPDLGSVVGGVPGGVAGGQIGGVVGGVLGGTGPSAPPPPPAQKPTPKLLRAGSGVRPPRQTYSVDPEYPKLALQTHIHGTVVVDAIIDEHGNVVQARVVSGHPLLIAAALKAVLQWKYEPTSLNGQPVSVELLALVNFT